MSNEAITVNKVWSSEGEYDTYDEALIKKKEIFADHDIVKIRRGAKGTSKKEIYRVKAWKQPSVPETKKDKKKKKTK